MKKILIYSFAALMIFIISCRKSDNPLLPAGLTAIPAPLLSIDTAADQAISSNTPDAFSGKVNIQSYYSNWLATAKLNVVVIKNGDATKIKTLQTGITGVPAHINITGAQLIAAFGPIITDDYFDIGADIVMPDGTVYPAFSSGLGAIYSAGILSQPGFNPTVRYGAICKFTATDFGAYGAPTPYYVIRDDWADYTDPTDPIPVTVIDATHISFKYAANDAQPIIIKINPKTNAASVASQVIGNYGAPYGDFSVASINSNDNAVKPCDLQISVTLHFTESKGSDFGNSTIILKRK